MIRRGVPEPSPVFEPALEGRLGTIREEFYDLLANAVLEVDAS